MTHIFPQESTIADFANKTVILTNARIILEKKEMSSNYYQSIPLRHVTSCENHRSYLMSYLALSIISFCAAAYSYTVVHNENNLVPILLGIIGLTCLVIFIFSTNNILIVGSSSTKMKINVNGVKKEIVKDFISKIEEELQKVK